MTKLSLANFSSLYLVRILLSAKSLWAGFGNSCWITDWDMGQGLDRRERAFKLKIKCYSAAHLSHK